jgi:hypothetical protein
MATRPTAELRKKAPRAARWRRRNHREPDARNQGRGIASDLVSWAVADQGIVKTPNADRAALCRATGGCAGADKKTCLNLGTVGRRQHYNLELRTDRSAGRAAREDSCGPA